MEFTPRELDLIRCAFEGCADKETAYRLGLATNSVKQYWARIREKHPGLTRNTAARWLVRDHQRQQAIRLDQWLRLWQDSLPTESLPELRAIIADQVSGILR